MESKTKNLHIFLEPTKVVGDPVISISFSAHCDACALSAFECGSSTCFCKGAEEAALCHSLYSEVRRVLCGDPLVASKSKVGDVSYCAHNGHFSINFKCKSNGSAIRKALGIALKVLDPAKVKRQYVTRMNILGQSSKYANDTFDNVAGEVYSSINKLVVIGIVGKLNVTKDALNAIADVLADKLDPTKISGGSKPSGHTGCTHESYVIEVKGWQSFIIKEFIISRGAVVRLCDDGIMVNMSDKQWDSFVAKNKKMVDVFVDKLMRLDDNLSVFLAYTALSSSSLPAQDVRSMLSAKMGKSDIKSILNTL